MRVGSLVECVDGSNYDPIIVQLNNVPVQNKIYTVRGINNEDGIVLEEIVNEERLYANGYAEVHWRITRFKELLPPMVVSIESILEEVNI